MQIKVIANGVRGIPLLLYQAPTFLQIFSSFIHLLGGTYIYLKLVNTMILSLFLFCLSGTLLWAFPMLKLVCMVLFLATFITKKLHYVVIDCKNHPINRLKSFIKN